MPDTSTLSQAVKDLKEKIEKEASDLRTHEMALQKATAEKQTLDGEIKTKETEIKQKEADVQRLKNEVSQAKTKILELERTTHAATAEIAAIKQQQTKNTAELTRSQQELTGLLKNDKK